MLEDETVKDFLGGLFLFGPELRDGLELNAEFVVGPALVVFEHELAVITPRSSASLLRADLEGSAAPFS